MPGNFLSEIHKWSLECKYTLLLSLSLFLSVSASVNFTARCGSPLRALLIALEISFGYAAELGITSEDESAIRTTTCTYLGARLL